MVEEEQEEALHRREVGTAGGLWLRLWRRGRTTRVSVCNEVQVAVDVTAHCNCFLSHFVKESFPP